MRNIILFDDAKLRLQLLPFTYTRPTSWIRCGIHTLAEKWALYHGSEISYLTEPYLQQQFPLHIQAENTFINGTLCPNPELVEAIWSMPVDTSLYSTEGVLLAVKTTATYKNEVDLPTILFTGKYLQIEHVWDIFLHNGDQIKADYDFLTKHRQSETLVDPHTRCYNSAQIFIEPGASIKAAILNAEDGPIYIGKNAIIQEGASIQGPFAIGESGIVAQNAKIRPNSTIGPFSKVGGEVSNSVLFGYSNKGHDGYLGNSVLGEWCNLGANTNNSNLKNDWSNVKLHSYVTENLEDTHLTFCGLFMGDYSKSGISTMFNTGTVVGVCVNVFGSGFQDKHVPSFSWGGSREQFTEYRIEKAIEVARNTIQRKGLEFTNVQINIMKEVYYLTRHQRMPYERCASLAQK
jgi:UDP-N-acetylglucosamine diphosphorylase/glucosamine-1-phosphate N-acetyltransferase